MFLIKPRFYSALFFSFIFRNFFSKKFSVPASYIKKNFRFNAQKKVVIHFYAAYNSAGTKVVISDVVPEINKKIKSLSLPWNVVFSNSMPRKKVDYLICFKCLPIGPVLGKPKIILSICDEGENFWDSLKNFDAVVVSSSFEFASLLALKNNKTFFICESENLENINFGFKNIKRLPSERPCNLFWHGLPSSMEALTKLKPYLIQSAKSRKINLLIVSGKQAKHNFNWGRLSVSHFPWSPENMKKCAKISRIGIVPARETLRTSYLKPASRLRVLYALGVPSIGDASVPNVRSFSLPFNGPIARTPKEFSDKINWLLDNSKFLDNIAIKGLKHVKNEYSGQITANQWINFFLEQEINK